jgi:hypothetical protein
LNIEHSPLPLKFIQNTLYETNFNAYFKSFIFSPVSGLLAQRDAKNIPQIKVENSKEAKLFLITWSNQKSSTIKFPPFHLVIGIDWVKL